MDKINYTILSFGKQYQGILKLVGAVLSLLLALGTIIHFINITGFMGMSYAPVFSEVMYTLCMFFGTLITLAGFGTLGAMLLMKPKHIIATVAIAVIALGEFIYMLEDLFYYIWQGGYYYSYIYEYPYIPMILLGLLTAVAWALPALAGYMKNKDLFRNYTLVLVIIPAALFILDLFIHAVTGTLYFNNFFYNLLSMVLLAAVCVLTLSCDERPAMDCIREMNNKNAEQRWQEAYKTQPGQTAHQTYAQPQQQTAQAQTAPRTAPQQNPPADGYIGIVPLILFSIITFGIYIYIWIYKTTKFFDYRLNRQGSFSPGLEVVLCLFVPFYFIYWIYKQTKAAEEAHHLAGNHSNDDLAIINILLCVFGLGLIAYALLQDQINKLCTGYTEPPRYDRPQSATNDYNFDPMTGEPIRKEPENNYNFDPMTGEPIRKEAAPVAEEIFREIPIEQASSAEIIEEAPAESIEEAPAEIVEEAPAEIIEEVPAEITEEAPTEITEEAPAEIAEEAPAEIVEEVPAEIIEEVPAEIVEETPAEIVEETPALTADQEESLRMLQQLREIGILSQEEFDAKKADILK